MQDARLARHEVENMRKISQLVFVVGLTLGQVDVQPLRAEPIVVYSTLASSLRP
jgi:hypothetical protein